MPTSKNRKRYHINDHLWLVKDEDGVRFHVESGDYFASLATIIKLWPLFDNVSISVKEIEADLMFLQDNYYILPKSSRKANDQNIKQKNNPNDKLQNQ